jgi:predicted nucleic acid-binding protein
MIEKVYIDSNIFIWGYNFPQSNSAKLLDVLIKSDIEIFISEKVIEELRRYFCNYFSKDIFSEIQLLLFNRCTVIFYEEIEDYIGKWKGKIKDKDLVHICIIKKFEIPILISYDKDFIKFQEYLTPRKFVKLIGIKPTETEY